MCTGGIHQWQDETHLTDSLTAPPVVLRGGSGRLMSSFWSAGFSVKILTMCMSAEVRDGDGL